MPIIPGDPYHTPAVTSDMSPQVASNNVHGNLYQDGTSSQDFLDAIGLGSMVSLGGLPFVDQSLTTMGVIFDYDNMLNFQRLVFLDPDVPETITANYAEQETLDRTIPLLGYRNTTGREIKLSIHLIADVMPLLQITAKLNWYKTFLYPRDTSVNQRPPKKVVVAIGLYTLLKGVVTTVSWSYPKAPLAGLNYPAIAGNQPNFIPVVPQYAVVDLTIKETEAFWTGGQMDYEQAELDAQLRLPFALPSFVTGGLL